MKNLIRFEKFINEKLEEENEIDDPLTSRKERIRNRIKTLTQRSVNVMPWNREGRVYLDDCADYYLNRKRIMIIYVDYKGATYESMTNDLEQGFLNWNDMLELSEDELQNTYNNLVGTIRNESW